MNVEDIKKATNQMAENFRISHGVHKISFPDQPTTVHSIKEADGYMILILADFRKNNSENYQVSKKTFALSLAKAFGVECSPEDFKADF